MLCPASAFTMWADENTQPLTALRLNQGGPAAARSPSKQPRPQRAPKPPGEGPQEAGCSAEAFSVTGLLPQLRAAEQQARVKQALAPPTHQLFCHAPASARPLHPMC